MGGGGGVRIFLMGGQASMGDKGQHTCLNMSSCKHVFKHENFVDNLKLSYVSLCLFICSFVMDYISDDGPSNDHTTDYSQHSVTLFSIF